MTTHSDSHTGEAAGPGPTFEDVLRLRTDPAVILVDVLPREAYSQVHIAGSISIPLADIKEQAAKVLPDRSREIIVYCGGFT
jgi:rhodanese-related sulfurtransferase